jgi:hypothetical protein
MGLSVDLHEDFAQMPPPFGICEQLLDTTFPDLGRKYRTEPIPPKPYRFMADLDTALMQQVLDISEGKEKPNIQHHGQTNDLGRRFEIAKWAAFCHSQTLEGRPARFKTVCSDSAHPRTASRQLVGNRVSATSRPHR